MKQSVMLTITSLLSILFASFHIADDVVRGFEPGGLANLIGGTLIMVVSLLMIQALVPKRAVNVAQ